MGNFYSAGGVFMTPLTLLGIGALLLMGKKIVDVYIKAQGPAARHRAMVNLVLQIGIFTFFLGILSQAIGLMQAFSAIEQAGGDISPALLVGGLKVSMIAPVYGLMIFRVAVIGWAALKFRLDAMAVEE